MSNFHVVPRNDAITHETRGNRCSCAAEVRTIGRDDEPGCYDVWYYHRVVSIDEALLLELPVPEPRAEAA